MVIRFPDDQGVSNLPSFEEYLSLEQPVVNSNVTFRPSTNSDLYYDEVQEEKPDVPPPIPSRATREIKLPLPSQPAGPTKRQAPTRPPQKPDTLDDTYV